MQKTNKEIGPALVGIELEKKEIYTSLIQRLKDNDIKYTEINKDDALCTYLI